ncbi:MAG: tRNA threonylcarbamoyladenosine biosynthesis protein RimN [Porticoccus sp.]|jgi:L-threonylcarbamoyladenylate synthase|nr:tRNA threonylcarbamoyladenosine biosynthesis protein RimN [Porticoccus sp.]|tara:strand:+ start:148 stop:717 length:570 start_codon:yes stop_codon:yes gene_type:complete
MRSNPISFDTKKLLEILHRDGVIAYPTEAVWGLGCDPFSEAAVKRVLSMKRRKKEMGLILIAKDIEQLQPFLTGLLPREIIQLKKSWPGPQTWLVPNNNSAPSWITGENKTLALRVTNHPTASKLCEIFGGPLVSTSANPHGLPPAKNISQISTYFDKQIEYIIPGSLGELLNPTPIKHLKTGKILRQG